MPASARSRSTCARKVAPPLAERIASSTAERRMDAPSSRLANAVKSCCLMSGVMSSPSWPPALGQPTDISVRRSRQECPDFPGTSSLIHRFLDRTSGGAEWCRQYGARGSRGAGRGRAVASVRAGVGVAGSKQRDYAVTPLGEAVGNTGRSQAPLTKVAGEHLRSPDFSAIKDGVDCVLGGQEPSASIRRSADRREPTLDRQGRFHRLPQDQCEDRHASVGGAL